MTQPQQQNNPGQAHAGVLPATNLLCSDCWHWFWTQFTRDDLPVQAMPYAHGSPPALQKSTLT
jgi:hypothetical protein